MAKKFGIVSDEVVKDPSLSLRAKGLYALLCSYADKNRQCYPKINTLAEFSGVSRRSIERTIIELESKGYLRKQGRVFILK